jgi:putative addiction module component (TIGR02574 family)
MSRPLADLTREAIELPPRQRLILARMLLDASDSAALEPASEVEAAWENELAARIQAIDAGKANGKSWDSVLQDINQRFAW